LRKLTFASARAFLIGHVGIYSSKRDGMNRHMFDVTPTSRRERFKRSTPAIEQLCRRTATTLPAEKD
jgi:hypothetical protein